MLKNKEVVIAQGYVTKIFPNNIYEIKLDNDEMTKAIQCRELKNSSARIRTNDKVLVGFCKGSSIPEVTIAKILEIKR